MREQLEHDISAIEREIRVAKESQVKLEKWDISTISTISNISQNIWRLYPTNGSVMLF
jgi:hypothetical protein